MFKITLVLSDFGQGFLSGILGLVVLLHISSYFREDQEKLKENPMFTRIYVPLILFRNKNTWMI